MAAREIIVKKYVVRLSGEERRRSLWHWPGKDAAWRSG